MLKRKVRFRERGDNDGSIDSRWFYRGDLGGCLARFADVRRRPLTIFRAAILQGD
jgi:hypothetical protein